MFLCRKLFAREQAGGVRKRPAAAAAATGAKRPKKEAREPSATAEQAADRSPKRPASLRFPGVPKGTINPAPLHVHGFKIYTSIASQKWRALEDGKRVGTALSFGKTEGEARASWSRLVKHVHGRT